jgi:hypothetical protein
LLSNATWHRRRVCPLVEPSRAIAEITTHRASNVVRTTASTIARTCSGSSQLTSVQSRT